jgi:hypothetical protein
MVCFLLRSFEAVLLSVAKTELGSSTTKEGGSYI